MVQIVDSLALVCFRHMGVDMAVSSTERGKKSLINPVEGGEIKCEGAV